MKRLTLLTMAVAATITAAGSAQITSVTHPIYPVVQDINKEVRLIKFSPDVAVEQLRGSVALSHLRSVMSRRADAFV